MGIRRPLKRLTNRFAIRLAILGAVGLTLIARDPSAAAEAEPNAPLRTWMKANMLDERGNMRHPPSTLASAFDKLALLAPSATPEMAKNYVHWASIARDGAAASRVDDVSAVRAACRGCHEQYRAKYKSDLRDRPLQ